MWADCSGRNRLTPPNGAPKCVSASEGRPGNLRLDLKSTDRNAVACSAALPHQNPDSEGGAPGGRDRGIKVPGGLVSNDSKSSENARKRLCGKGLGVDCFGSGGAIPTSIGTGCATEARSDEGRDQGIESGSSVAAGDPASA